MILKLQFFQLLYGISVFSQSSVISGVIFFILWFIVERSYLADQIFIN